MVCDRWRNDFNAFLDDVGPRPSRRHSIDRINNSGNYEPGNVRWATQSEQMRNTRSTRVLTLNETTASVTEWAERTGIKYRTILMRLNLGWPAERILLPEKMRSHGALHPASKTSAEQVKEMRSLYAAGGYSYRTLGARYGLSAGAIQHIIERRTWAHVE